MFSDFGQYFWVLWSSGWSEMSRIAPAAYMGLRLNPINVASGVFL